MKSEYAFQNETGSLNLSQPSTSSRYPKSEKLQAFYNRKQAYQHLEVISNRVSQLEKIKYKTQKEIEQLKIDILKEEDRISLKNKYNQNKRRFRKQSNDDVETRRILNKKSREDRRKSIQDFTQSLLEEKQKWVREKKARSLRWQEEITDYRSKDQEKKYSQCKKLKTGYVKSLRQRCVTQRNYEDMIRTRYSESIQEEKRLESEAYDRITELEEAESSLINDLSNTIEIRKGLKENLKRLRNLSA